ncbi:PIG-L family deacetylase [Rubrivirga sp. S365]|uniref:PIG-L family deacetylase n=1 Tax=Rubrivirga sp. S365 TaxID=3076080 RepID=UPI0028C9D65E|nr:PIG-L family deacetylase [Rubrivirga sp. S365]MDT7857815.1 PIG-L family deacetylase [Rubrivirga sp. S365]
MARFVPRFAVLLALVAAAAGCAPAQAPAAPPRSDGAAPTAAGGADRLGADDLGGAALPTRPLVVMNLAAHPDDEDGLTMAYYRGNQDAAVYSVVFTRGEGGQNEAGPDLYERLGAIRTAETERAARILGTRVTYLNRYDFGFSKHAAEAFDEWSRGRAGFWEELASRRGADAGREMLVADLVRVVRRYKPDVLFTNHDTSTAWPDAQHGHHQAVGISAAEAFDRAADPAFHPEQLAEPGVDLWQPQRLFVRVGGFQSGAPERYDVAVPVGDACRVLPDRPAESCADRAVAAAAQHVSQGFDTFAPRFRRDTTYFALLKAAPAAPPLPPGATDLAAGLGPNPAARDLDLATLVETGRLPVTAVENEDRVVVGEAPTLPAYRAQYDRPTAAPPGAYRLAEGGAGAVVDQTETAPPVVVDLAPGPVRLEPGPNPVAVALDVYDHSVDRVRVHAAVEAPDYVDAVATAARTVPASADTVRLTLDVPETAGAGRYRLRVVADAAAVDGLATVGRPAAVLPDVSVAPGLRVGFVRSYDDVTESALRVMGADVVPLDSAALAQGDFDGLDAIVLDIRALLVRPDLAAARDQLLAWVRGGGHLVVGYHKSFEWNEPGADGGPGGIAPYPLHLGRDRVTVEEAPVDVLAPAHPVFHAPHEIDAADWAGWVQERGLYFPDDYDGRYQELVATGDPGEAPLRSGILYAEVGAGTYVYSPLVWYRQLDALNPGAWRLVANLVSLPLTRDRVGG